MPLMNPRPGGGFDPLQKLMEYAGRLGSYAARDHVPGSSGYSGMGGADYLEGLLRSIDPRSPSGVLELLSMAVPGPGRAGRFSVERMPNGFTRVSDRSSGLVGLYNSRTGRAEHGDLARVYRSLDELPSAPPQRAADPRPTRVYTDRPIRDDGKRASSGIEGSYSTRDAARARADELRREGVPGVRVWSPTPKRPDGTRGGR